MSPLLSNVLTKIIPSFLPTGALGGGASVTPDSSSVNSAGSEYTISSGAGSYSGISGIGAISSIQLIILGVIILGAVYFYKGGKL